MNRFAAISVAAAISASTLALLLALAPAVRMPQVARGDGALAVAFGDARETISHALVHKADSYFHGGIDMECHSSAHPRPHSSADPWTWINSHVRAPERHIHLDGGKSVELMPWFWAAVRADPHNIDAWTTAWYVANNMLKDRALARRIIDEAKAKNPDSLEIAFAEARFVYDGGKGDAASAERLLERALESASRRCGGRLSGLSERDAETCSRMREYLCGVRKARVGRP